MLASPSTPPRVWAGTGDGSHPRNNRITPTETTGPALLFSPVIQPGLGAVVVTGRTGCWSRQGRGDVKGEAHPTRGRAEFIRGELRHRAEGLSSLPLLTQFTGIPLGSRYPSTSPDQEQSVKPKYWLSAKGWTASGSLDPMLYSYLNNNNKKIRFLC